MPKDKKVAVVTGGGSGIGRAIALRLARDGAAVAIWGRSRQSSEETVAMIVEGGGTAVACVGDASRKENIEAALVETHDQLGSVSILVNNASIAPFRPFLEISQEELTQVLHVNFIGSFLCAQSILPDMLERSWGRIVNITSTAAQDGIGTMSHYSASKAAVIGMTKSLAIEFADKGITVNHIPPFFVDTPMLRSAPLDLEEIASATPMKRMGRAEEVAAACAYLVSEEAGYVTGQAISLNGGRYLP